MFKAAPLINQLKYKNIAVVDIDSPNNLDIFAAQLAALKQHRLYNLLDFIIVVKNFSMYSVSDGKIISVPSADNPYTSMMVIKTISDLATNKIKILYFHTKSFSNDRLHDAVSRKYLEYFLIEKHKICINALDIYSCVGVNLQYYSDFAHKNNSHYWGNYWWTSSSYIKLLDTPESYKQENIDSASYLAGKLYTVDHRCLLSLHRTSRDLIQLPITPNEYNYERIKANVLKSLSKEPLKIHPIYGCYFIYCIGIYQQVVEEQMKLLVDSGLYDATERLLVFICGVTDEAIKMFEPYKKVQIIATKENLREKFAINNYKKYVKPETYYLYYFHAKGVSHQNDSNQIISDWRKLCNYFTLVKWRLCSELLSYYDCVGVQLTNFPKLHFSGNFWWARSEHLTTLSNVGNKWLAPELYVCSNLYTNYISLHQADCYLGISAYPPSKYNTKNNADILADMTSVPKYNTISMTWLDGWFDGDTPVIFDRYIYNFYKRPENTCPNDENDCTLKYSMTPKKHFNLHSRFKHMIK